MKYIVFLLFLSFLTSAQVSINTGGGNVSNASGNVSFTVGQIFYKTIYQNASLLNEGVQQPYEIVTLAIEEQNPKIASIVVYPNPTNNFITVDYKEQNYTNHTLELIDFSGKQLQKIRIQNSETNLSLANYPSATYLLIVLEANKPIQKFKIIKN